VSTDEQARRGVSLEAQREQCLAYCAQAGLAVVRVIVDAGETSRTPLAQRPAGRDLAACIAAGEVEHVVAYSQSRLFRDNEEALRMARAWTALGITIHLLDAGGALDLQSPDGRLMYGIRAAVNQHEVDQLRRRVSDALLRIAETGRVPANRVYGYRRVGKALEVVPEEAVIVRQIFAAVADGASMSEIAVQLNEAQVPTPREGATGWDHARVRLILRSPIYTGHFVWRATVYPGTHEPIVSQRQWDAVQQILDRRAVNRGRRVTHLTRLYRCGLCGSRMCLRNCAPLEKPYRVYMICRARKWHVVDHQPVSVREALADDLLWNYLGGLLRDGVVEEAGRAAEGRRRRTGGKVQELRGRIADLEARQLRNLEAMQAGALTPDLLAHANRPLVEEHARLSEELATLEAAARAPGQWVKLGAGAGERLVARLRKASMEKQLAVLEQLVTHVDVVPGRLVVHHPEDLLPPAELVVPRYYRPSKSS